MLQISLNLQIDNLFAIKRNILRNIVITRKALKADKKGFYSVTGEKGNLFININLEIPKKLNGEEVALLERLKMSENFMYKT